MLDLKDKDAKTRALLKAAEIVRVARPEAFSRHGFDVDVQDISVDSLGVVVVLARAFKDGKQLGFGDGTIDIERFRFSNPPTMVPDGTFTPKSFVDPFTKEEIQYDSLNHKEDVMEALRQVLVDTVRRVAKDGTNVEHGKVGSTVTTAFASYSAMVRNDGTNETWTTIHDAATGDIIDTTDQRFACRWDTTATTDRFAILSRSGYTFDTSAIPDTDVISAAILSLFGDSTTHLNQSGNTIALNVYDFNPADPATYATADFDQFGTTEFSTEIVWASWSTSAYNDFTLNASGIANISKTGNSVFGAREANFDAPNIQPTWSTEKVDEFGSRFHTAAGTTNDPKLVVTHAAAAASGLNPRRMMTGVGM